MPNSLPNGDTISRQPKARTGGSGSFFAVIGAYFTLIYACLGTLLLPYWLLSAKPDAPVSEFIRYCHAHFGGNYLLFSYVSLLVLFFGWSINRLIDRNAKANNA